MFMVKVWTRIYEPMRMYDPWIGEIWVDVNGNPNVFDTIIDPDREMFYHWLNYYAENTRNCFQNTDDLEEGTACYLGA
jgi:hypothetical protein